MTSTPPPEAVGPSSGSPLPPQVQASLAALVPDDALTESYRGQSRSPGHLDHDWAVVPRSAVWHRLGFDPPTLPSLAADAVREHFAVHGHNGKPSESRRSGDPCALPVAVFYLPVDLPWEKAQSGDALSRGATFLWLHEPYAGHPWTAAVRCRNERDDRRSFTVVEVAGVHLGVQVDTYGLAQLSWTLRRGGRDVRAIVTTKRDPSAAVQLLLHDGVLT
ncbi:hypothetical protein [Kineococcus xinjiangensis]|uniref:hypothetical protein n=1 Tax=Kineococcus xinjiangensis TaxID=512762 RepID=UPI000CECD330|nr:hypothetical protein [Kineococcus xinjiangensis]